MKCYRFAVPIFILMVATNISVAQNVGMENIIVKNLKTFAYNGKNFEGEGWELIKSLAQESANVLIGEDHFSNEIPAFTEAIIKTAHFDNFIIEIDPYSAEIIEKAIKLNSLELKNEFNRKYKELFSFYSLKPEYSLLENAVKQNIDIIGSDQIVMYADRLIFQELAKRTKDKKAKDIYSDIVYQSKQHLESFYKDPKKPMYLMTDEFSEQLDKLDALNLTNEEDSILLDVRKSIDIYKNHSHEMRIQLILHHLMLNFDQWKNQKNLFKYGAMHMARGESFLNIYDIGNLVGNITNSNYENSFHVMIVGESGMLGSPLKIFPASPVNIEKAPLKSLKPFFKLTEGKQWHAFNLLPLREQINNGKLKIDDVNLERVIKGFDVLVIIPEVTAAVF